MTVEEEIAQELSVADWGTVHSDYIVSHYTKQARRILPIIARREQEIERETVEKIVGWIRDDLAMNHAANEFVMNCLADAVERGDWKG